MEKHTLKFCTKWGGKSCERIHTQKNKVALRRGKGCLGRKRSGTIADAVRNVASGDVTARGFAVPLLVVEKYVGTESL